MQRAFTLLELMITITIIAVISVVVVISLSGRSSKSTLDSTIQQIGALLREAQSNTMSQSRGASWGVHLDNTNTNAAFYSLFYTTNASYAASTQVNRYVLPPPLCYATSTVAAGSSTDIIFSGSIGAPSASATIIVQLMTSASCNTATSTGGVSRSATGKIFFDDFNRSSL